jgi:hypothetical protein
VATTRKKSGVHRTRPASRHSRSLRVRLTPEEYRRLPRPTNLSRWVRNVLLQAAAGTRVVGPDLQAVHDATAKRAWLCAIMDELLRGEMSLPDQTAAIARAAGLVDEFPEIFDDPEGRPCT